MKIPGLDLDNLSFEQQIQLSMLLPMIPFLVAYFLWYFAFYIFDFDLFTSLSMGFATGAAGYIMYYQRRDRVRNEAVNLSPITMTLRWDENHAPTIYNMVVDEPIIKSLGDKYYTVVEFQRTMYTPEPDKSPFKQILFIEKFPHDRVFHEMPDQIVVHRGDIFRGAASKIDATFREWTEELEPRPVFVVTSDPESTIDIQRTGKVRPIDASKETIEEATAMTSIHYAMRESLKRKETEASYEAALDAIKDSKTRGLETSGRVLEDERVIYSPPSRTISIKKHWKLILALAILAIFLLWLFSDVLFKR